MAKCAHLSEGYVLRLNVPTDGIGVAIAKPVISVDSDFIRGSHE